MSDTPRGRVTQVDAPAMFLIRVKKGLATMILFCIKKSLTLKL